MLLCTYVEIAVENMMLAAESLRLGTLITGGEYDYENQVTIIE